MSETTPSSTTKVVTRTAAASGAVLTLGAALVATAPPASAAPFTVTNTDPSGAGSLAQAIDDANTTAGADTITFAAGLGTIAVPDELDITEALTITGPATLMGNGGNRIFYVHASGEAVTLSGLTISGGEEVEGGAILARSTDLIIQDSVITGNEATDGSGGGVYIYDAQTTQIIDSTFSDNTASDDGGGLSVNRGDGRNPDSSLVVSGSTFTDNHAYDGGGLATDTIYDVQIDKSTFNLNEARDEGTGGAIYVQGDEDTTVSILSSTISGNDAGYGGGIGLYGQLTFDISHSTIVGNTATYYGGAIFLYATGAATLDHVLMGNNTGQTYAEIAALDGDGGPAQPVATSFSMIEGDSTPDIVDDVEGNTFGEDPGVAALADNGGPTQTHALLASSAALDGGNPAFAPPPDTDQRGLPRDQGEAIDIGAYETQPEEPAPVEEPPAALPAEVTPTFTG